MKSIIAAFFLLAVVPVAAFSGEIDCAACHPKLTKEKFLHPALEMGCPSCHTGVDAGSLPHKITGSIPKGLAAEQPDLCYGCHDKGMFKKKHVHPAVDMGCTACHNPHSAGNQKLLIADIPDLCFGCHDRAAFSKKTVHPPVAAGMCLTCHTPHASDQIALLVKKPFEVCLDCHADIPNAQHVISGFGPGRHPLGEPRRTKAGGERDRKDPARAGRPFYCGSCHNPHSTDGDRLFRFNAQSGMSLCTNCHKM